MVQLKMTDNTVLFVDDTLSQIEHTMKGMKQGCIHGFLDREKTHPILISLYNIVCASEGELSTPGSSTPIQENVILYSE